VGGKTHNHTTAIKGTDPMGRSQINWPLYNKSLINRGNITFWFSKDMAKCWYNKRKSGSRGASNTYSQSAIDALSLIRFRFRLTLRETQGFGSSLTELMGICVRVPNYTTLCRRLAKVSRSIAAKVRSGKSVHVVVDSTGLKVFGEGEWKVRQHGYSKRRTWMKLHLAVDESDNQILSVVLTDNSYKDNEVFEELMYDIEAEVGQATGDGAYDAKNCWDWTDENDVRGVFPPRKGAKLKRHGNSKDAPSQRDKHIRLRRDIGKKRWKKRTKYSRRSLAETAMYRFKVILGDELNSRESGNQIAEAILKCKILNMMPTPSVL
jgi:hypothetical protein